MPSSRHQLTLACLRHREAEARELANQTARAVIRDRGQSRELVEEAIAALATHDEATHALSMAEAQIPKPIPTEGEE